MQLFDLIDQQVARLGSVHHPYFERQTKERRWADVVVCVPVTSEGSVDLRWGRADRVAIAKVAGNRIVDWQEFDVGWGVLHDAGPEGSHHARVARFLQDHHVEAVVANHMGEGMLNMLGRMGVQVHVGALGAAREAAVMAVAGWPD